MASKYRDDTGELHPLFTGEDHGKDYHDGQRWRAGIAKATADEEMVKAFRQELNTLG